MAHCYRSSRAHVGNDRCVHSGPDLGVALVFAAGLVLWGLGSARLTRWNITAPLAFVAYGLLTVWACQAGKDVYVEKNVALTIWEGRKMIEASKKYKRIVI